MYLEATLQEQGLREVDAKIYLALLELGESTVLPIARKAGIQRPYCYDILRHLIDAGLVSFVLKNGRRRYIAEDPLALERKQKETLEHLSAAMPALRSLYVRAPNKPRVQMYEGREGLITLYEELVRSKSYVAISSPTHLEQALGDYFVELAKRGAARGIQGRELITRTKKPARYLQHFNAENQQVRFLPRGTVLKTDLLLYGEKLVMIAYGKTVHAVAVEGSEIVETHRALFELLWAQAEPA